MVRSRAVYVADLNFTDTLAALGPALTREPYKAPPRAPVLHIKPENTWAASGSDIVCPLGVDALRMGGSIAAVIGRTARRVDARHALEFVQGYVLVNDVSVPYESHYRPAVRQRCRDGFCPIGAEVAAGASLPPVHTLTVRIHVNDTECCAVPMSHLVRGVARLIADVSAFMTLDRGDLLAVGEPHDAPLARPGDGVRVSADGFRALENRIVAQGEATT